jgi:hypothetical protein
MGNPALVKGGPSLNPLGKPKGTMSAKTKVQEAFLAMMSQPIKTKSGKMTEFFTAFNEAFAEDALQPGSVAYKFMAERLYGLDILESIDHQVNKAKREDADFTQYRIHRRAFDIQQKVLLSKSRDIGLMCGRRAGKSETNKLLAIAKAMSDQRQRVLIIGLTVMKTQQIYWDDMNRIIAELGFDYTPNNTDSIFNFGNGSIIQFGGNSNKVEREKYRGMHWDLIIIDEAQSQHDLGMFVKEIINPMLLDTNGQLVITGSGPRTRGTYWEQYFLNPSPSGSRLNWNLSQNPHIHNYEMALADEREKHGLSETDPLYMREYLGLIVYDDDCLVYRLGGDNKYHDDEMLAWLQTQSPADIRFTAGLDFGFRDSDAFVVIMYSEKANEKWLVYEYKQNGTDVTTLCDNIKAGKDYIKNSPLFARSYNRDFDIFADTSDQKISLELSHRYGIPVQNAIKYDKAMAVQNLQEEVRKGNLKIRPGSGFEEEALRTIFKRIEQEGQPSVITREIDDDVFHPDLMDALLYSLRYYWLTHSQDHAENQPVAFVPMPEQDTFIEQSYNRPSRNQLF